MNLLAPEGSAALRNYITLLPKIDLHRHLEGSISPELLISTAKKYGVPLPSYDLEVLRPLVEIEESSFGFAEFLKKFQVIGQIFKNVSIVKELTYQVVLDAAADNLIYLELRFSPIYMASSYNLSLEDVVSSVQEGVVLASQESGITVNLILIIERQLSQKSAKKVLELATTFKDEIVAVDLANDEYNYPPAPFAGIFDKVKELGLGITIHAGEAGNPQNIADAIELLNASRIGHGVNLHKRPDIKELVLERGVTLEMCPTSNLNTGAIRSFAEHPLKDFFYSGIKVTINTDDPAISRTSLSKEILRVMQTFGFTMDDIKAFLMNSVEAAFVSKEVRENLRISVNRGFARDQFSNMRHQSDLL